MKQFDYESKLWGANLTKASPLYLGGLRLKYCLESLLNVKGKVLDVGCGGGGMIKSIHLYRPDLACFACDISQKAIKSANFDPQGVHFSIGDGYILPYKDGAFDAVVLFDVLEHVKEPKLVINEVKRVLKKNGIFHAFIPCEGSSMSYVFWLDKINFKAKEKMAGHIQRIIPKFILQDIEQAGFKKVLIRWSNHPIYQLFDMLYFSFLYFRGKNVPASLESITMNGGGSIRKIILGFLIKFVSVISYYESLIFFKIPSMGLHLTLKKV